MRFAGTVHDAVLRPREAPPLQKFLQFALVISARMGHRKQFFADESFRRLHAAVEIDARDQRLEQAGNRLVAHAGRRRRKQKPRQPHPFDRLFQRRGGNEIFSEVRHAPLVFYSLAVQFFRNEEAEDGIPQKFEAFVALRPVLMRVRRMGKTDFEQFFIFERIADATFDLG